MQSTTKKILFHSILLSGHLNSCSTVATCLLNNHPNFEAYFVVDNEYGEKLRKKDPRFKVFTFDYEENEENKIRTDYVIDTLESCLKMDLPEKTNLCWTMFIDDERLIQADKEIEKIIEKVKFDFIIADQNFHVPSLLRSGTPYSFLCSYNPLAFSFDGLPLMGCDARLDDKERIEDFRKKFEKYRKIIQKKMHRILELRGAKYENANRPIDQTISDCFNLYIYPEEVDYYDEQFRNKHKLWQIDTSLNPEKIPPKFELPEDFKKLPNKIVYVSFGTIFSSYTYLMQKLINDLNDLPYKYIVSKGLRGDKITFPSNKFIGENFVNQLAVLQVADAMIAHGGNNSLNECFYFGVPCIISPIIVDQFNNATRLEEKGFGFSLDIQNYTKEDLATKLNRLLNDEHIISKWKAASKRIQNENKISTVVQRIADYIERL